jgi:predicted DNA-binding protein (UPF0251 family)
MARPIKWRRVGLIPQVTYFKPAGVPMRDLEEVALSVEEAEAIRLKDLKGLEQEECAKRMHISRPTFHRVLQSARRKVADILVNGKALRIGGGNFALPSQAFQCRRDGHVWSVPAVRAQASSPSLPRNTRLRSGVGGVAAVSLTAKDVAKDHYRQSPLHRMWSPFRPLPVRRPSRLARERRQ